MLLALFGKHLIWSVQTKSGRIDYYYYDEITWGVAILFLIWLTWILVGRYRRANALRRKPRRNDKRALKRVVKIKDELSKVYLRKGFSKKIHAVGVGKLEATNEYCIQVFINDSNENMFENAPNNTVPNRYRNIPVVLILMPQAGFLSGNLYAHFTAEQYHKITRGHQEIIMGGISGANTNLNGQCGTIGYLCIRKTILPRKKDVFLLSNSHVFADLRKSKIDNGDLIMQPSPGEPSGNRPIADLVKFSALKFSDDIKDENYIDAAIAKLWRQQEHKSVIPLIGSIKKYVPKVYVEIGEGCRKFGRTTGYTGGKIFSIHLDIWIRYDRTGQEAFFKNQFLIEPDLPRYTKFVDKGDSGSLVVDSETNAVGLIFAGMNSAKPLKDDDEIKRIENYGVANPISDVLEKLNIELLI